MWLLLVAVWNCLIFRYHLSVSMDWQDIEEKETFYKKIYGSEHRKGVETFPRENMPWWHYDQNLGRQRLSYGIARRHMPHSRLIGT